jgi:hypothetical protein
MGLKKLGKRRHYPLVAEEVLERLRDKMKQETAPPKFCKDCHWHSFERIEKKESVVYHHFCKFPPLLDMLTGQPSNAAKNRNDATRCGREAKHFTAKIV